MLVTAWKAIECHNGLPRAVPFILLVVPWVVSRQGVEGERLKMFGESVEVIYNRG
jgi:hypothetical protein